MKGTGFVGTVFAVVNLAEILNSPFGRDGTSMKVTPGLWGCGSDVMREIH